MKYLDEVRALATKLESRPVTQWGQGDAVSLARAVLAMLPVVEAARYQETCKRSGDVGAWAQATGLTEQAVAAFRAANREGETEWTS